MGLTLKVTEAMLDRLPPAKKTQLMENVLLSIGTNIESDSKKVTREYQKFSREASNFTQSNTIKKLELPFTDEQVSEADASYRQELEHLDELIGIKRDAFAPISLIFAETSGTNLPVLANAMRTMLTTPDIVDHRANNLTKLEDFEFYKKIVLQSIFDNPTSLTKLRKDFWLDSSIAIGAVIAVAWCICFFHAGALTLLWSLIFLCSSTLLGTVGLFVYNFKFRQNFTIGSMTISLKYASNPLERLQQYKTKSALYRPFMNEVLSTSVLTEEITTSKRINDTIQNVLKYVRTFEGQVHSHIAGTLPEKYNRLPMALDFVETSEYDINNRTIEMNTRLKRIESNVHSFVVNLDNYNSGMKQLEFPRASKLAERVRQETRPISYSSH